MYVLQPVVSCPVVLERFGRPITVPPELLIPFRCRFPSRCRLNLPYGTLLLKPPSGSDRCRLLDRFQYQPVLNFEIFTFGTASLGPIDPELVTRKPSGVLVD